MLSSFRAAGGPASSFAFALASTPDHHMPTTSNPPDLFAAYQSATDASLLTPANPAEIAAILRIANQHGIPIHPSGGPLHPTGVTLSTQRLNTVREHTWQDLVCTVDAGCTWAAMQTVLAQHGQFVALDPLSPTSSTVGAIVATNDSGALRHRYGSLRDLIIGMTIVLADGTIARSGGKVVKNVAGYDLHKLMTGARSTLGVIADVTFRLHATPKHTCTLTAAADRAEPLGNLLLAIINSHLSTEALQLRSTPEAFHLDIQLAALPSVIQEQIVSLNKLAAPEGLHFSGAPADLWLTREKLSAHSSDFLLKATMLPTQIPAAARLVQAMQGSSVTQAVGVMTAAVPADAAAALVQLRFTLESQGGSLTLQQQPSGSTIDPWGKLPDTLPLMRAIKQRFDPNGILNPNQFLGGI